MVSGEYRWGVGSGGSDLKTQTGVEKFGSTTVFFMRIQNDGTNVKYYFSMDFGVTWTQFYSEAVSNISTVTQWGFQSNNSSSGYSFGATFWALYKV